MISTPEGELVFVAEAGVLAVIDATLGQTGFEDPTEIKTAQISSQGVRAVELLLDPEADLDGDPDGPEALIYVAGGRLGLWVMQADPRPGYPMLATRIDAGVYQSGTGRTWCNSLEIVEIGETQYLAALFAHQECSRLRLYDLGDVRDLLDPTVTTFAETGNELSPDSDVGVGGNCLVQTPRLGSFGYGMAVDGSKVYLAMGVYGLVQVSFTTISTATVTAAPYFGTGSPSTHVHGGYDDLEFRLGTPGDYFVVRHDPPQFMDVVVQDDGTHHWLWAAVDHLGIVAFDLTATWSTTMSIAHQEGVWVASDGLSDTHIQLVKLGTGGETTTSAMRNHAHRLAIVEATDGEDSGLVLAVGVSNRPLIQSDSILDEGRVLGHLGLGYQGTGWPGGSTTLDLQWTQEELLEDETILAAGAPAYDYTLLYELGDLSPESPTTSPKSYQYAKFLRQGGRHLYLPPAPPEEEVVVLGGHVLSKSSGARTFLARYDWPLQGDPTAQPDPQQAKFLARDPADRPGWHSYDISYSPTNPELIYMGSTDGGCLPAGIMADCGSSFVSFFDGTLDKDTRGTFGILYNPLAIWPAPPETVENETQAREFIFGAGRPVVGEQLQKPHWMLVYFEPGVDLCDPTPTRLPDRRKTVYVKSLPDNFKHPGRGFYNGAGGASPGYDSYVDEEFDGDALAFVGRSASPAGIWVLNRAELEHLALDDMTIVEGEVIDDENGPDIYVRELLTHPEFANVYNDANPANDMDPRWNFLGKNGLNGRVLTLYPELLEIPAPEEEEELTHWVLAVPCAAVQLPPDLEVFGSDPTNYPDPTTHPWYPDPVYVTNYDHALVQVFDVSDYEIFSDITLELPVYTLLGPRDQSSAIRIKTLTWTIDEVDRSFLFVSNFTDSLMAWEITNLLDESPGRIIKLGDGDYGDFMLQEWITPDSISDDLPNNVWHLEVAHETWHDGETSRDEVYVYVAVGRYGIAVLNFQPDASPGQRLTQVGYLQTPNGMAGLRLREEGESDPTLLISETNIGLRSYVHPQ